jgi:hypothetical protein
MNTKRDWELLAASYRETLEDPPEGLEPETLERYLGHTRERLRECEQALANFARGGNQRKCPKMARLRQLAAA